eukprot:PhM_4_TR8090/c1_g1_i1/m.51762
MDLGKLGLDPRRLGQEIELDVRGHRKRVGNGEMREHYHKFWFVEEPSVIYEDNDIVEVFEKDMGKKQARRGTDTATKKFIIESIFIAHERKSVEGWYLKDDGKNVVDEPATILCRQVVSKLAEHRVPETTGSMKKMREKYDKVQSEKQAQEKQANSNKPNKDKKKTVKMPDFSKPSQFQHRQPAQKKKSGAADTQQGGADSDKNNNGGDSPSSAAATLFSMGSHALGYVMSQFSCCYRVRVGRAPPPPPMADFGEDRYDTTAEEPKESPSQ